MLAESVPCDRAGADLSKRADMTGQRGPRQAVAAPASTIATAPAMAAARQGAPAMIARPGPGMTISCTAPPEGEPLVVEPPSGPDRALARAAARTAEARRLTRTAAAVAAPSAASASALASGTSCCPVTAMSCAGSGLGGVKMACAQAWRAASTTRPAPTAPASSTRTNSLRILQQHIRVEAGPVAAVASRTDLVHLDHQGVAVAVQRHRLDPLVVPGRVALDPVLLAAARPVGAPAGGKGAMQRLVVHPAEHQHLTGVVLLGDGRDQAGCVPLQ